MCLIHGPASSDQFFDDAAIDIRQTKITTSVAIRQLLVVESEQLKNRRLKVVDVNLLFHRLKPELIGCAVDIAALDAAACEEDRVAIGPMIAPGRGVNARSSSKFSHGNDQGATRTTCFEILDEGGHPLIKRRQQVMAMLLKAQAMRVPVLPLLLVILNVDERDAGFNQPAGQEQILAANLSAKAESASATGRNARVGVKAIALTGTVALLPEVDGATITAQ